MWFALGLGNPGEKYANTRHNAGARAVAGLAVRLGTRLAPPRPRLRPGKPAAWMAEVTNEGERLVLARPTTFMNESGLAAASLLRWFKGDPEKLIVIHDEIDLAEGALRIQFARGSGGHRGVASIIKSVATQDFYRVRIGVGRPGPSSTQEPAGFVLEPMSKTASARLAEAEASAGEAVLSLIHEGLQLTMTRFNSR